MFFAGLMLLSLVFTVNCQINATEDYPHSAILDAEENVKLFWKFNDTDITFELHGKTAGWIGMGISPGGSMAKADMVVGWVKSGTASVTDRHGSDANGFPPLDPEQNVELLDGREEDGWTLIKFRRQLASCEPGYDLPVTGDTLKIIYAYGANDPSGDDISGADYHKEKRGGKSLYILDGAASSDFEFPAGEEHSSFDLLNDHFEVPAQTTYYNCRLHKIPEFSQKQHLVKVEPVIQEGNELHVHHILVYQCSQNVTRDTAIGSNTQCYGSDMPPDFQDCSVVVQSWAIGGGPIYYPTHAGYPLGEEDSPKYAVVETHYDNPLAQAGIIDSSGLRFVYTSQLRQYDAAVIEAGHTISGIQQLIPPNAESYLQYGDCQSKCLDGAMKLGNVNSINIFGVQLHTHLLGESITLRHIRNTTELPYVAKDDSYDFNFQETRMLSEERVVMSGDSLQVVCNYKSKDVRENMTVGGLDTQREMCEAFVYYYPKIPLSYCQTAPQYTTMLNYFGVTWAGPTTEDLGLYSDINDIVIYLPEDLAGKTLGEHVNGMEWNEETCAEMSSSFRDMKRSLLCRGSQGYIPVTEDGIYSDAIAVDVPYVEEEANCTVVNDDVTPSAAPGTTSTIQDSTAPGTTSTTQDSNLPGEMETTSAGMMIHTCYVLSICVTLTLLFNML